MSTKTYGQLCPMARALDVLGDRWTLLLVREMLLGPKRFKDLLSMLPAMGSNRLSERLTTLLDSGVVRRTTLPVPDGASGYELTESGERLRDALIALGLWGLSLPVDERIEPSTARAELIALCLTGVSDPAASAGLHEVVEFQVGMEAFHLRIDDGKVLARSGRAPGRVDLRAECDMDTFMALARRQISPSSAQRKGQVRLSHGSAAAFNRLFRILEYRP